jgi:hypothetical protein
MRIPFLSIFPKRPWRSVAATQLRFTREDRRDFAFCLAGLEPHGVICKIEAVKESRSELGTIYYDGVPVFEVWRATDGLHLRFLTIKGDVGDTVLQYPVMLWTLIAGTLYLPVCFMNRIPSKNGVPYHVQRASGE